MDLYSIVENRLVRVAILFIACVVLLALIAPKSSAAYIYEIHQGENVYQGDTADLSLVASWPKFQLAWCNDGDAGCGNPTIIDLGNENQHKVLIKKDRFPVGNYYRWDGAWHRGEYSFAMRVLPSPRPANESVIIIGNKTIVKSEVTQPAKKLPNSTHIVLARGDDIIYQYAITNETEGNNAYMWMFQTDISGTGKGVLGSPMVYRSNDSVYQWELNSSFTENIIEGNYAGYIQYSGDNNRADVFFNPRHKTDTCNIVYSEVLDTIYDDDIIQDVDIVGLSPMLVKDRFETLSLHEYSDDTLIPVTMSLETPMIMFTDYSTEGNNITVSGKTSMSAGTIVVFKLDPQQYKLQYDINAHTWSTAAIGEVDEWRTFNITMPINWDEMAVGANHTVVASVDKYKIHIDTSKDFKVSDVWVMPTPTPERERVVVEEYGWHRVTPTTIATIAEELTPEPVEPNIVEVVNGSAINQTIAQQNATVNETVTTMRTPTPIPTTRDRNITVPLPVWIAILAVAGAVMWRRNV